MTSPDSHRERSNAQSAFLLGNLLSVASLFIGNPYVVPLCVVPVLLIVATRWRGHLAWMALSCALAANPLNSSTPVSLNLIAASAYVLGNFRVLLRLPGWTIMAAALATASAVASMPFWKAPIAPAILYSQASAIANYIIGPLLLMPAIFINAQRIEDKEFLAEKFLLWLVAPSLIMLLATRLSGEKLLEATYAQAGYQVTSIYKLWNVDVYYSRTQVGFVFGAIAAGTFAVVLASQKWKYRLPAGLALGTSSYLLAVVGAAGSSLAAIAGAVATLLLSARTLPLKRYALMLVLLAGITASAYQLLPQGADEYIAIRYDDRVSGTSGIDASDRFTIWSLSAKYALENPNGIGWSLWVDEIATYPHNEVLSYTIAFGIICGLAYAFAMIHSWVTLARSRERIGYPGNAMLRQAGIGVATVLLVNSMSDHLTANRWYYNVVWSMVWFCLMSTRTSSAEAPLKPVSKA